MSRVLIIGCGYTGTRLAGRLNAMGCQTVGTTRSEARAAELEAAGIQPLVGDLASPGFVAQVRRLRPDVVLHLAPPLKEVEDTTAVVLQASAGANLEAFVYASSTSVYGDRQGEWVDETTQVQPKSQAARARQRAEGAVSEAVLGLGIPARICRITGIYGPARTLRRALAAGDYQLIRGHDTWVNRIHVDDLVSGLIAAWQAGADGRIYNLVDDRPHRSSEFANLAAELHGLGRPRWVDIEEARRNQGEARLRRKLDSKRVKNLRLKEELGVLLRYPDYRVGLPAAVDEERVAARSRRGGMVR